MEYRNRTGEDDGVMEEQLDYAHRLLVDNQVEEVQDQVPEGHVDLENDYTNFVF